MSIERKPDSSKGLILITLASILYATYGIWTKLLGNSIGSFYQAGIRGAIVAIILFVVAFVSGRLSRLNLRDMHTRKWLLVLFISNAFIQAPMFYAINKVGMSLSMGVGYMTVAICTYLLGRLFNRERLGHIQLSAIVLGIISTFCVYSVQTGSDRTAFMAAIVSGIATAFDIIALQKLRYGVLQAAAISWVAVAVINLPIAILLGEVGRGLPSGGHLLALATFALTSVFATIMHTNGLRRTSASSVGLLGLLEIVFAIIIGFLFFKEHATPIQQVGLAGIMIACALPYVARTRMRINTSKVGS